MVRDNGSNSRFDIYDAGGTVTFSVTGLLGTDASVTQLDNGNIVIVYQDADSILYEVRDTNGGIVVAATDFGIPGTLGGSPTILSLPTVTATAGGFIIGHTNNGFGNENTSITAFANDGTAGASQDLVSFGASDETDTGLATLTNGTVATVTEQLNNSGLAQIRTEVWNADGTSLVSANSIVVDQTGTTNRNPAIVALENGGYAIIYEDNENREGGLTMVTYTATGVLVAKFDISGISNGLSNPEATLLNNGLIAISVTESTDEISIGTTDDLTIVRMIDPTTGLQVGEDYNVTGDIDWEHTTQDSAITTLENGTIAVVHERIGTTIEGEILQPVRFSNGSNTFDVFNGDEFVDVMVGGSTTDHFYSYDNGDFVYGGGGDDLVYAGAGDDVVSGDGGVDFIYAEDGEDQVHGGEDGDFIYGGAGNDLLVGENGADWIYGEADNDVIMGQNGSDVLFGGTGNDQIFGGAETDTIFGEANDDFLYGQEGGDVISGQDGNDQLHGGDGGDFLFGGDGYDTLYGNDGVDQLWGQAQDDYLNGGAGVDDLHGGTGNDRLYGGDDGDSLFGDENQDDLHGEAGGDVLNGGTGNDRLNGGADGDFLFGDAGVDTLIGGSGNDQLYGGSNGLVIAGEQDNFLFEGPDWGNDTIHDFEDGVDRIQFNTTSTLDDFTDLTVTSSSGNAILTFGADSITVIGAAGLVTAADVDFLV